MAAETQATKGDPRVLVDKLRKQGLSDQDIVSALRNWGYSSREARAAVEADPAADSGAPKPAGGTTQPPATPTPTNETPATPAAGEKDPDEDESPSSGSGLGFSLPDSLPRPTLKPPRRLSGGDVAGFGLGLFCYVLFINYLTYGPAGVKGWLSAKFLNKPLQVSTGSTSNELDKTAGIDTGPKAPQAA